MSVITTDMIESFQISGECKGKYPTCSHRCTIILTGGRQKRVTIDRFWIGFFLEKIDFSKVCWHGNEAHYKTLHAKVYEYELNNKLTNLLIDLLVDKRLVVEKKAARARKAAAQKPSIPPPPGTLDKYGWEKYFNVRVLDPDIPIPSKIISAYKRALKAGLEPRIIYQPGEVYYQNKKRVFNEGLLIEMMSDSESGKLLKSSVLVYDFAREILFKDNYLNTEKRLFMNTKEQLMEIPYKEPRWMVTTKICPESLPKSRSDQPKVKIRGFYRSDLMENMLYRFAGFRIDGKMPDAGLYARCSKIRFEGQFHIVVGVDNDKPSHLSVTYEHLSEKYRNLGISLSKSVPWS